MQRGCGIIIAVALETSAGFFEREGGPAGMFAWLRVEATMPLPRILVMRNASADRNRAGMHVAIIDVPAFFAFKASAFGR